MINLGLNLSTNDNLNDDIYAKQQGMITITKNKLFVGNGIEPIKALDCENNEKIDEIQNKLNDEPIVFLNLASNATELNTLKSSVTMNYIFNKWQRNAVQWVNNTLEYNNALCLTETSKWSYDSATDYIKSNYNSASLIICTNDIKVNNFDLTIQATGDGDDDYVGLIIAMYFDGDKFHTLSIQRKFADVSKQTSSFKLLLDMSSRWPTVTETGPQVDNSYILASADNSVIWDMDHPEDPFVRYGWSKGLTLIKAERNGKSVKCWTGPCSANQNTNGVINNNTLVSYTLPDEKPIDMTDEQWKILNKLLLEPNYVGFSCLSQNTFYRIISQNNVINNKIYNILNNKLLEYNFTTKQWAETSLDLNTIPKYKLISSSINKKLFYNDGINIHQLT